MITKKIELDNYNLHLIKLETFKSVTIDFKFKYFYEKESLPALNFLSEILTFTNKKYNKRNDFVNEQMDLYDLELNSSFYTKGKILYDKLYEKFKESKTQMPQQKIPKQEHIIVKDDDELPF